MFERTRLAQARMHAELTQRELAEATGIDYGTYWRLEAGRIANPQIRHLTNCALVLGIQLEDVCEPEWLAWTKFHASAPAPVTRREIVMRRFAEGRRGPRLKQRW